MFGAIRRRLLVWNTAVLVALLVALGVSIYFVTARTLYGEVDRTLRDNGRDTLRALASTPGFPFVIPRTGYQGDVFYLGIDLSGRIMENPQGLAVTSSPDPVGVRRALEERRGAFDTVTLDRQRVRVLSAPIVTGRGDVLGVLQVGRSIEAERSALDRLALILALSEAGALVVALAGGWFLAERALVPIRRAFDRQRRFVSDASHELRTPLALIRASGETLARHGPQTVDENRQLVDSIVTETDYLGNLVSGLLTLAQSDAGRLPLKRELVELDALAMAVAKDMQPLAQAKGQELRCDICPGPLVADADRARIRQVLLALLDNAVKYTGEGGRIELSLRAERGQARLAVSDTGRGIAPEHLPHVFERFRRADEARGRDAGGAGLGLSIAKALVEAHQGEISLESAPGQGTTVRVRLPLAHPEARTPRETGEPAPRQG